MPANDQVLAAFSGFFAQLATYHPQCPVLAGPAQQAITSLSVASTEFQPAQPLSLINEHVARSVTINYEYDPLNRLTSATYGDGTAFCYIYAAVGNVLEYTSTINGTSITTTYTYDAANQLLTATKDSTTWHYTYDGNGSLIQATPGDEILNGAKRYIYSAAGFLVKVETYTNSWQSQAEMASDGLGNRLEMTGYADGQSITTQYELDNGRVMSVSANDPSAGSRHYFVGMILMSPARPQAVQRGSVYTVTCLLQVGGENLPLVGACRKHWARQ